MVETVDQMPQKYKVLITGSSGMLGIDLANELRRGYRLTGTDTADSSESRLRRFYKLDITDFKSTADVFKKVKPDIVVHTAAWTDVDGCELNKDKAYAINSDGTRNVALACKRIGAVLVYISTDFVFDGKKKRPYREDDKTGPLSVYADSKLEGETAVKKTLKKYFILRTSWLYGKHGKNFVDTITAKSKKGGLLKVVDDQIGSPTYTKDLAKAIRILIGKNIKDFGVYHVSNSGSVSWYEYARAILKISGVKAKVVPISSKELARPARRPAMSVLDSSKFEKVTGHKMRNWKIALQEYLN